MDIKLAMQSIGQPFRIVGFTGGIVGRFDVINRVDQAGTVHADFLEAPAEDCRLKMEEPEQFKQHHSIIQN